ncbi:MAG: hypothetical protein JNL44_16640 [Gemmatimonadetes bacterium]|nr:hypothetical protein [Gemmatimonadota bacterium]
MPVAPFDHAAVDRAVRATRARAKRPLWPWYPLKFALVAGFLFLLPLLTDDFRPSAWSPWRLNFWLRASVACIGAAFVTWIEWRQRGWLHDVSHDAAVERLRIQWNDLTRPGWYWRATAFVGGVFVLCGVLLAGLIWYTDSASGGAPRESVGSLVGFVVGTGLVGVALTFAGRAALLWQWRRWIRRAEPASARLSA